MNVLHVNQWDNYGGSAKASLRIHETMRSAGVDSFLYVQQQALGTTASPIGNVALLAKEPWLRAADTVARRIQWGLSIEDAFYPSTVLLTRRQRFKSADILQLYNIHGGYFGLTALRMLSRQKPVFWRLSDMAALTGHCSHADDCNRWQSGCGECPIYRSYPPAMKRDTTALHWRWKRRVYSRADITFLAPSTWMKDLAERSPLVGDCPVEYLPNSVETDLFKPLPKEAMRQLWGFPADARLILIGTAMFDEGRRGSKIVRNLLQAIGDARGSLDISVVFFGGRNPAFESDIRKHLPLHAVGYIADKHLLATLYNAVDILLHPALEENLSNSVMESVACGTPAFCYDIGGLSDVVRSGTSGCLVAREDVGALAASVVDYLRDTSRHEPMRASCRAVMEGAFTAQHETDALLELYRKKLGVS